MSNEGNALLEVRGLVKDYPGVRALGGVDLSVTSGQVHCLIGQNGAGKSTLIKCVSGLVEPTAGEVLFEGAPLPVGDPNASIARGIATIYQELDLVPHLSVALNVFLGHERRRGPLLNRAAMHRETVALLARLGEEGIAPTPAAAASRTAAPGSGMRASLPRRRSRRCGRRSNRWSPWPERFRTRSSYSFSTSRLRSWMTSRWTRCSASYDGSPPKESGSSGSRTGSARWPNWVTW